MTEQDWHDFEDRTGELRLNGEIWGYLRVHARQQEGKAGLFRRRRTDAVLSGEYTSLEKHPDRAGPGDPGWNDFAVVGIDEVQADVQRLRRGEFLLMGRSLEVRWLDGDEAAEARRRIES